jgi:hypothetical protein
VGSTTAVEILYRDEGENFELKPLILSEQEAYFVEIATQAADYMTVAGSHGVACTKGTDGLVNDAFDVVYIVESGSALLINVAANDIARLTTGLGISRDTVKVKATMSGNVECVAADPESEAATETAVSLSETVTAATVSAMADAGEVDIPAVTNDFDVEFFEESTSDCDFEPPTGGSSAILQGSDTGFELQLFAPFGLGITGDGAGGFSWTYRAPPVGFGETNFRMIEVLDIQRSANTLTLLIEETRFTDDFPEGCTRTYTVVYTFADETVLDFIGSVPSGGAEDVKVENPDIEGGDGFFTLEGQFANTSEGQVYHVWTEVSGVDITYDLTQIVPNPDGTFITIIDIDLPDGTFVIIRILANGRIVISSSGDAPSSD